MGIIHSKSLKEQRLLLAPLSLTRYVILSPTCAERLHLMGRGLKSMLMRRLSLCVGNYFEPRRNYGACHNMMLIIACRVTAGLAAAVRDKAAKDAEALCASGQCAAALVPLQKAIVLGDLPSCALKAWMLFDGREGVAEDHDGAFQLVEEGARLGCHHCQGVMSRCYLGGFGCEADEERSLMLARKSSNEGSRYGILMLCEFYRHGRGTIPKDRAKALEFYRRAAEQNLDAAQLGLGCMYYKGLGVAQDLVEALRWWQLAAAQGHPAALYWIADSHKYGRGVAADVAEAIRWYRRAQAAGYTAAAADLRRLHA